MSSNPSTTKKKKKRKDTKVQGYLFGKREGWEEGREQWGGG
jgi:hypothetical protein